jgi:hypothetical protein
MTFTSIIWDLDDEPDGNVRHCAAHGVSQNEVEEALGNANDEDVSRSPGRPIVFGYTKTGRYLAVVFERVDEDAIYPATSYDV